jgi:excisionase family DNA binding protein
MDDLNESAEERRNVKVEERRAKRKQRREKAGAPTERATLTIEEVALKLGVGRAAAYRAAHLGEFPGVITIGRRLLVSRVILARWLSEGASTGAVSAK